MANLLAVWRAHALDKLMRACWENGVVLSAESVVPLCWHSGTTDSSGDVQLLDDGLGFLTDNSMPYLHETLASLSDPPYRPLEIVLVDSGSADGPPEYVRWDEVVKEATLRTYAHVRSQ
ncbi:MAG: hypothetical protein ACRDTH_10040 [Pseudonocardiaceae bacterium]